MELFRTLSFLAVLGIISSAELKCKSDFAAIVSEDCQTLYRCVWGKPVKMPSCPEGLRFSKYYHVCVYKGTQFDDCQYDTDGKSKGENNQKPGANSCSNSPCKHGGHCEEGKDGKSFSCNCPLQYGGETCERVLTKAEQCERDATLVTSHPDECQLYYDCGKKYDVVPAYFEQYLQECPYPQLFSEVTLKCENFTEVDCGKRKELKSACDYRKFMCNGPNCIPCHVNNPSCEGKADGLHPHGWKAKSPHYMICKDERFVSSGMCEVDPEFQEYNFPKDGKCVSRYEVEKEQGGLMPTCEGKMDGSYADEQTRCDRYFVCDSGMPRVLKCPEGTRFDSESRECIAGGSC